MRQWVPGTEVRPLQLIHADSETTTCRSEWLQPLIEVVSSLPIKQLFFEK